MFFIERLHNTRGSLKKSTDESLADFHVQDCAWESVMEYLRYIKRHEQVVLQRKKNNGSGRDRYPNTKKGKKEKRAAQRAKRKRQISYVCGLLEELDDCVV